MLNNISKTAGFLFLFLVSFGCALQSSLVDLEQEVDKTQKMQQELAQLRGELQKMARSITEKTQAESPEGNAILLEKINRLEEQLLYMEGRLEKGEQQVSTLAETTDDRAHRAEAIPSQIDTLLNQVNILTKRIEMLEKPATPPPSPREESPVAPREEPRLPPKGEGRGEEKKGMEGGTPASPSEAYRLAYNDYLRGNYNLAIISFQNYITQYPNSTFVPESIYWMGQSYYNEGMYKEAAHFFEQVEKRYPAHEKAPNALLKTGLSLIKLKEPDQAKIRLWQVVERHPQSDVALKAKAYLSYIDGVGPSPE
jgi:tol-pal system protein YbgF